MLIGYTPREVTGKANVTGTVGLAGATWLTADGGAALFDGRPSRKARMQWGAGTPAITQYVSITATFQVPVVLRVLALLGTTLPVGCRVDFLGAGADGLGDTCDDARTMRMPDDTVGVWGVARDDDAVETGVEVRIYNDVGGLPWASAGTVIDIGQVVAMPACEVPQEPGWELGEPGAIATAERTRSGGVNSAAAGYYQRMHFVSQVADLSAARGAGLANGMDWRSLRAVMMNLRRIAVVPRYNSPAEVNATALYGCSTNIGSVLHLGGDQYRWEWDFEEVPAM